jgi:hypothetical protein
MSVALPPLGRLPSPAFQLYLHHVRGLVEVAIDIHDGNGPVTYVLQNIVGIAGEPAVPATVYLGFIGSCGALTDRHQVNNLEIETLQ